MPLNEIIATISIVRIVKAGSFIGSATSFFYTRQDHLFLVTNRHVVRNDGTGHMPDTLRLRLHRNPNNLYDNGDWDVSLYVAGSQLWKTPPAHPDADVALIRLEERSQHPSSLERGPQYSSCPPIIVWIPERMYS